MNMLNVASPKKRISQGVTSAYVVIPFYNFLFLFNNLKFLQ